MALIKSCLASAASGMPLEKGYAYILTKVTSNKVALVSNVFSYANAGERNPGFLFANDGYTSMAYEQPSSTSNFWIGGIKSDGSIVVQLYANDRTYSNIDVSDYEIIFCIAADASGAASITITFA